MSGQLLETTFVDGLQMPHYDNGRLLSARDLQADQAATLARLGRLGQAVGHGVVDGLMVTQAGNTSVQVTAGLGLNCEGQIVRLPGALTLNLAPATGATPAVYDAGLFQDCTFVSTNGGGTSLADGAYLLTAMPVARLEGQAPLKSTPGSALPAGCGAQWEVEGIQFKAIKLAMFGVGGSGATDKNRQSRLAHWCYGSAALRQLPVDPFSFDDDYTGLASLPDLTACDLPLAVFYWQGTKIAFVDAWPARRRVICPLPEDSWRGLLADSRVADAQARFLQFQAQVDKLLAAGSVATLRATDHFRYLPPVGYLPVLAPEFLVEFLTEDLIGNLSKIGKKALKTSKELAIIARAVEKAGLSGSSALLAKVRQKLPQSGFDLEKFFGSALPAKVYLIDGESVDFYLQRSWYDEAIDLLGDPLFDVYLVKDVWQRLVGKALISVLNAELAAQGVPSSLRQQLLKQIAALLPPDVPGGQDAAAAMFVKQVRPKVTVPVTKPPEPPAGITGEIVIWHGYAAGSPEAKVLQSLAAQVEKDNPAAKISLLAIPSNDLPEELLVAVAAGGGPDLVLWRDEHLAMWVEKGIVEPLDQFITLDSAVLPAVRIALTMHGDLYGVPVALDTVAMHLNRELMDEVGVSAPKNTNDLVGFVESFAGSNFPVLLPLPLFFPYGLLVAEGGPLVGADGKCEFEAFVAGFELLQRLARNGASFADYTKAAMAFGNSRSPIMIDGPWALAGYQEKIGGALEIISLPEGERGDAHPLAFVHAFYLTTSSKNKANAAQVAALLASAEAQKLLARDANKIPARQDVAVNDEHLGAFAKAAAQIHPLPAFPGYIRWEGPISEIMAQVVDGRPPDDAAKAACDVISG